MTPKSGAQVIVRSLLHTAVHALMLQLSVFAHDLGKEATPTQTRSRESHARTLGPILDRARKLERVILDFLAGEAVPNEVQEFQQIVAEIRQVQEDLAPDVPKLSPTASKHILDGADASIANLRDRVTSLLTHLDGDQTNRINTMRACARRLARSANQLRDVIEKICDESASGGISFNGDSEILRGRLQSLCGELMNELTALAAP